MNRNILLRVTAPAVLLGVLMLGACLGSVYAINRLQTNLAGILSANVTSLQAAQEVEIKLRQLRFHSLVALLDPGPEREKLITQDDRDLEQLIQRAGEVAPTDAEKVLVQAIKDGYHRYLTELSRVEGRPGALFPKDLIRWSDQHPIRHLQVPCQDLLKVSRQAMKRTAQESEDVAADARAAMLLLGVVGPLGGLVGGYGIARGLSRSMARLNVWVRDVHAQIDQEAGSISLDSPGDLSDLDHQLQRVVGRVQELVERLQRQQQDMLRTEQLAAVGQLASSVAHEVRNPLTSIKLLIEVALRQSRRVEETEAAVGNALRGVPGVVGDAPRGVPEDGCQERHGGRSLQAPGSSALTAKDLEVIHGEIKRMEKTVQGLLDFARLPQADRQPCDLREVVAQTIDLIHPRADQQRVAVAVHQPGDPLRASVDRSQFGTVLLNLCLNALDAMPQGGRLDLELETDAAGASGGTPRRAFPTGGSVGNALRGVPPLAPAGPAIRVEVKDTGPGIAASIAERLFTPFTTTKATGTGLGLSICRRVMEGHGGTIRAGNRPEGGAVFTLTLPRSEG